MGISTTGALAEMAGTAEHRDKDNKTQSVRPLSVLRSLSPFACFARSLSSSSSLSRSLSILSLSRFLARSLPLSFFL
eukprot:745588-Rhodomonas_salina.1